MSNDIWLTCDLRKFTTKSLKDYFNNNGHTVTHATIAKWKRDGGIPRKRVQTLLGYIGL